MVRLVEAYQGGNIRDFEAILRMCVGAGRGWRTHITWVWAVRTAKHAPFLRTHPPLSCMLPTRASPQHALLPRASLPLCVPAGTAAPSWVTPSSPSTCGTCWQTSARRWGVPPAFPLPLPVLLIAGRVFRGVLLGGQMCEGQGERHLERRAGQGWSVGPAGAPAGSGSATCNPLLPHA